MKYWLALVSITFGLAVKADPPKSKPPTKPESEKIRLTQPRIAMTLLADSKKAPVLGTIVGNYVYYSQKFPKTNSQCRGKNLYRSLFALPPTSKEGEAKSRDEINSPDQPFEEVEVSKFECIEKMFTDGNSLFVMNFDSQANKASLVIFLTDTNGTAVSQTPSRQAAKSEWLFHNLEEETKVPWHTRPRKVISIGVPFLNQWKTLFENSANPLHWLLVTAPTSTTSKNVKAVANPFIRPQEFDLKSSQANFTWDAAGNNYLLLAPNLRGNFYRMAVRSPDGSIKLYGSDIAYTDPEVWEDLPKTGELGWPIRNPSGIAPANDGVLVHDAKVDANEWDTIAYFPNQGDKVYRVQLYPENLEGVTDLSSSHQGFVLSQPDEGRIIWYGRRNPFGKTAYSPRHIDLNKIVTEAELLKMQGGE